MALNDVIDRFATGTYTVTRTTGDVYDANGRLVDGAESTFTVVGVVETVGGRTFDNPTTGQETDEIRRMATKTRLITREDSSKPDIVTIPNEDGVDEDWLCVRWDRSQHWGDKHFVVYLERWVYP